MPIVHIYTAEGWLNAAQKKTMIESVTHAVVEAEQYAAAKEMTYVLVHEVADGGWGYQGRQLPRSVYDAHAPANRK